MKKKLFFVFVSFLISTYANADSPSTKVWGRSLVVEDSVFNNPAQYGLSRYDSVVYRNCTFQNSNISTAGQVFGLSDIGVVRFDHCTFRNIRSTSTNDYHAIHAYTNVDSLIITNTTFYNISADGIQVGHLFYTDTVNNYLNYMLVDNCVFENPPNTSTENGIDIKAGFSIKGEIRNSTFKGFHFCTQGGFGCSGANGEAIGIHYRFAKNIYIHDNEILDGTIGVYAGKGYAGGQALYEAPPKNIHIYNNVIDGQYSGVNIQEVVGAYVYNNFVSNSRGTGIFLKYVENMEVNNNTVAKTATTGNAIREYNASTGTTEYTNNLIAGSNGPVDMITSGSNNLVITDFASIDFVDYENNDFHLTSNSNLVIDQGINNGLLTDIDSETRPNGGYDVGADEFYRSDITSTRSWQTFPISAQTNIFTASYDAIANSDSITGVTGILLGEAAGYSSLSCVVSFANTGTIVARNGGAYEADSVISYTAGTSYHFRLEINVPAHTYSIYVTPEGGSEITLGTDYAFRTEQSGVTELDGWAIVAGTDIGTHTVDNMKFTPVLASTRSWQTFPMMTQTGLFTASYDAIANGDSITGVTGIVFGEATGYSSAACVVSFGNTGTIVARNGGAYDADSVISYTKGTIYHFRLEINIPNHTYNIYVTPEGGSEITLGTDYAFRTEQASVTNLDGWAIVAGTDKGSHTVNNMAFTEGVSSTRTWKTFPMTTHEGVFSAFYDAVPNADSITGVTGILLGEATGWSSAACLVSFANTGTITARNGGAYDADSVISYTAGTSYHFRLEINIPEHTYSIYVTPEGGSEITLGMDYAFRTEQASVTELDGWAIVAGTDVGTHTVSNMIFAEGMTSTRTWQTFPMSTQTNLFTATYDAVPNSNGITGVTGILLGEATGYSSSACLVSFANTGMITARDGGAYQSDATVPYIMGNSYHFRLEINIPNHIYSIYVTPEGEDEILLGSDFDFRTEQSGVSELDGWAIVAGTDVGSHTVSNMVFTSSTAIPVKDVGAENRIKIYPNPVNTKFNVVISPEISISNTRMSLFDLNGREIKNIPITSNQAVVNRGKLKGGIYFYRIANNTGIIGIGKLVVQ